MSIVEAFVPAATAQAAPWRQLEQSLRSLFFERDEVIRGLLVALLARQHLVLLGPPGAAKSDLAETLCGAIGARFFNKTVNPLTSPDELLGPVSAKKLVEEDRYERHLAGMLGEAEIAVINEIWKCNSATLNALLDVVNERRITNGDRVVPVPLQTMMATSNEMPDPDENLQALWDRFVLRYVVDYVKQDASFDGLLSIGDRGGKSLQGAPRLSLQDLTAAQQAAARVDIAPLRPLLRQLWLDARERLHVSVSDRRWVWFAGLVKAHAFLDGRAVAASDDLVILADALWAEPEQRRDVRRHILLLCNPHLQQMEDILDEAETVYRQAIGAAEDQQSAAGMEANRKLKAAKDRLDHLADEVGTQGKSDAPLREAAGKVAAWNREVARVCLGLE